MAKYNQCGLRYYFSYIAGWREPQTQPLVIGSIAHEAIEHLYRLPQSERTLERALELVREHGRRMLELPDYRPFADDREMKQKVNEAITNLFNIENPQELVVHPDHLEMALEVEINGVLFFGKVDRFTQDGTVRVTDYKTGRVFRPKNDPDRYVEGKFDQTYLYALAFKTLHDIDIEEVELIFLHGNEAIQRPVTESHTVRLGEELALMHAGSKDDVVQSAWVARRGSLCGSCSFAPACPLVTPDAPKPGTPESDTILRSVGLTQRT